MVIFSIGQVNLRIVNNTTLDQKGNSEYNAYEKDIAVVNLYFGDSTVFGIYVILLLQLILH